MHIAFNTEKLLKKYKTI